MNETLNSVYGGGLVHTIHIEGIPFQTWVTNEYGIEHTTNGTFVNKL